MGPFSPSLIQYNGLNSNPAQATDEPIPVRLYVNQLISPAINSPYSAAAMSTQHQLNSKFILT